MTKNFKKPEKNWKLAWNELAFLASGCLSPKHFELRGCKSIYCPLPVYPVFENENSNRSDENSVKQKIA